MAVVLFGLGRLIIKRVAYAEGSEWLVRIMTIGLILHLLAAPAQIFVVQHVYHGIADWTRYTHQGAILAPNFHHFDFTLAGANLRQIVNDGSVSIATGIVMAIVGVNLAGHLPGLQLALVGRAVFFYRAFTLTFEGAEHRRYALMLFFLPSLIFWTADVSKESIMMLSLGLVAYGGAKIFARRRGGFIAAGARCDHRVLRPAQRAPAGPERLRRGHDAPDGGGPAEPGWAPTRSSGSSSSRPSCSSPST